MVRLSRKTNAIERGDVVIKPKRFLFFDTETTGKANFRAQPDADGQPRLVQLAAILSNIEGEEIACVNVIIAPKEFEIPAEASAIHGITTEFAVENGVPLLHALSLFNSLQRVADVHVCHNADFDALIMRGECLRVACDYAERMTMCTMRRMTDVCRIPGPYGFKWPTLQEAYRHCFGREFEGAHDALADVRACKEIFFWLRGRSETVSQ